MRKLYILLGFVLGVISIGYSQQEAQYTQYMFTTTAYNPAYAGMNGSICAAGLFRSQWMGLKVQDAGNGKPVASPTTGLFMFDAPVRVLHGGLGVNAYYDELGYMKSTGAELMYSFHLNIGNGVLGFGPKASFLDQRVDFTSLKGIDELMNDPVLIEKNAKSDMMFDLGFGAFYKAPQSFYVGFSTNRLLQANSSNIHYRLKRMYWLTGGYEYVLPSNPSFKIMPSILLKTDFSRTSVYKESKYKNGLNLATDITCLVEYDNKYWGGLTYRVQDAVSLILGGSFKNFKGGLSYDITTQKLGLYSSGKSNGTVEVFLRYCFKIVPVIRVEEHINSRYF